MTDQPKTRRHSGKPQKASSSKPGLKVRALAATVLTRVFDDGRGLDGLLETKHGPAGLQDLSGEDKSLVRAIALTVCRHKGEIDAALEKLQDRPLPKNARHLHHTLAVAAAQILFMDIPDSAAVDLAVTLVRQEKRSARFASLTNALLRRMGREKEVLLAAEKVKSRAAGAQQPVSRPALNMPQWLRSRTRKAYGKERLEQVCTRHMLPPALDICVRSEPEVWAERLGGVPLLHNAVRLIRPGHLPDWPGFAEGQWWVQDVAAQLPAPLFGDIAGKRVADLCAAPGGKTAQLISVGAHVTAVERSPSRMKRLESNLQRLGMEAECLALDLFDLQPERLFDAILLDAPCSSLGTIRRHPDVQWTKNAALVDELAILQGQMIGHAAKLLAPNGTLIFANCSLDRDEGENMVAQLPLEELGLTIDPIKPEEIAGHSAWITGQGTLRTLPSHLNIGDIEGQNISADDPNHARLSGMDGFFAARFRKLC